MIRCKLIDRVLPFISVLSRSFLVGHLRSWYNSIGRPDSDVLFELGGLLVQPFKVEPLKSLLIGLFLAVYSGDIT